MSNTYANNPLYSNDVTSLMRRINALEWVAPVADKTAVKTGLYGELFDITGNSKMYFTYDPSADEIYHYDRWNGCVNVYSGSSPYALQRTFDVAYSFTSIAYYEGAVYLFYGTYTTGIYIAKYDSGTGELGDIVSYDDEHLQCEQPNGLVGCVESGVLYCVAVCFAGGPEDYVHGVAMFDASDLSFTGMINMNSALPKSSAIAVNDGDVFVCRATSSPGTNEIARLGGGTEISFGSWDPITTEIKHLAVCSPDDSPRLLLVSAAITTTPPATIPHYVQMWDADNGTHVQYWSMAQLRSGAPYEYQDEYRGCIYAPIVNRDDNSMWFAVYNGTFNYGYGAKFALYKLNLRYYQTQWAGYTKTGQISLGTSDGGVSVPSVDALCPPADGGMDADIVPDHVLDMRTAIDHLLKQSHYLSTDTGYPYWTYAWGGAGLDSELLRVAMGDRTEYGATGGEKGAWTNSHTSMDSGYPYDIDIGEINECVGLLEVSDI